MRRTRGYAKRAATGGVAALFRRGKRSLPAGLLDAGQFAGVSHIAETHAGDTELLEGTPGAAVDLVAVAKADRGSVARELLQAEACSFPCFVGRVGIDQGLLQFEALGSVALNNNLALLVAGNLGLLCHS